MVDKKIILVVLLVVLLLIPFAVSEIDDSCTKKDETKYDNGWIQCYEIDGKLIWKSQDFASCKLDTDCSSSKFVCADPNGDGATCLLAPGESCKPTAKWQCQDNICNWADGKGTCGCATGNEEVNGKCVKKGAITIGVTSCPNIQDSKKDDATGLMLTCLSDGKDLKWYVGFGAECKETSQCQPGHECNDRGTGLKCLSKSGESCSIDTNCVTGLKCHDNKCSDQVCQNGKKEGSETCDDGNDKEGDGCSTLCKTEEGYTCDNNVCKEIPAVCGDNKKEKEEQCDDGNIKDDDGCSSKCQVEALNCGDASNEQCADGNKLDGDGCSKICKLEQGYTCLKGKGKDQEIYLNSMQNIWSNSESNLQKLSSIAKLVRETKSPQQDTKDYCVITNKEKELEVQKIIFEGKKEPATFDYFSLIIYNVYELFGK